MEKLTLSIVTPYGSVYDSEVKYVIMPGSDGEFGVFPGHCSLLALLKTGVIEFEDMQSNKGLIAINWGHTQISNSKSETSINVIADGAVTIAGNTETKIAIALDEAKALIAEASNDNILTEILISRAEHIVKNRI